MWGPLEIQQHVCNCNIWVDVAPVLFFLYNGFAMLFLPDLTLTQLLPACVSLQQDATFIFVLLFALILLMLIRMKNLEQQKGKFNPCSIDL